ALQFDRGLMEHVIGTRFVANGTSYTSVVNNGLHHKLLLQSHCNYYRTLDWYFKRRAQIIQEACNKETDSDTSRNDLASCTKSFEAAFRNIRLAMCWILKCDVEL
ncbi:hypothetical protein Tco_0236410, partial [Tanacetum coccineum]